MAVVLVPAQTLVAVPVHSGVPEDPAVIAEPGRPFAVNRTVPKVEAPPGQPTFSNPPTDAELFRAVLFDEPLVPMGGGGSAEENAALAEAVNASLKAARAEDLSFFTAFLDEHPNSVWRVSLLTNMGSVYRQAGYFSKALEAWQQAWDLGKAATESRARATADRALGELLDLHMLFGHVDQLETLLEEAGGRELVGSAAQKVSQAQEGLWILLNKHEEALPSGRVALEQLLDSERARKLRASSLSAAHASADGASLAELRDLAQDAGLGWQMAFRDREAPLVLPSVVHLKVGHYSALVKESGSKIFLKDPVLQGGFWMSRAALEDEASGFFLVPEGRLRKGWRAAQDAEARDIRGKCAPPVADPKEYKPCDITTGGGCGGPNQGMPGYRVHAMLVSLNITDTPLWYTPPRGPAVEFRITYNQRESQQAQVPSYSNVGMNWNFDWFSRVYDDFPNVYVPGGGYELPVLGTPSPDTGAVLVKTSQSPIRYERQLPDGSLQVYGLVKSSPYATYVLMTEWIDPQGQGLTFTYDASYRLVAVTDAVGQVTTLAYTHPTDNLKLTRVTDPFGRFATLDYDSQERLIRVTDMAGMVSEFTYAPGIMSSMKTPYGTTMFRKDQIPIQTGYLRYVEATDPLGGTERVEYRHIINTGFARMTLHWDKRAMALYPGDDTKAKQYVWKPVESGTTLSGNPEWEKLPLENQVSYTYPPGDVSEPSTITRTLDDGSLQTHTRSYNSKGNLTQSIDPLGRETLYEFAPNEIDILRVKQKNGAAYDLLTSYTYNAQHEPLTYTDASGQTTTFTYNAAGQLLTVTNPKSETWTLAYAPNGYLQTVTGPVSGATLGVTWDGYGRPRTLTNSDGYTITIDYDVLDRPTKVTYPNGTYEQLVYDRLHPQKYRDLLGRWTQIFTDALRRPTAIKDPLGRILSLQWCDCGVLDKLLDGNGHATSWDRDAQGRVTKENLADGTSTTLTYENTTSRVKRVTDAKGQVRNYSYLLDDRLSQVSYTNVPVPTPSVSFSYDSAFGRLLTRADGTGTTTYSYNPIPAPPLPTTRGAGRLASIDGPLANDLVSYTYDELGRVVSRSIDSASVSVVYDALGRLTNVSNALGSFSYAYDGATGRVASVTGPNGLSRVYSYLGLSGDRQLQEIRNQVGATVRSKFNYTYNANNDIASWTQEADGGPAKRYDFGYDSADQLSSATLKDVSAGTLLKRYVYSYDKGENRLSEQIDDAVVSSSHNAVNELTNQAPGGSLRFAGTTNETATVAIQGKPAQANADNTFSGQATVGQGTSSVTVAATDPSGNTRTNTYEVSQSGVAKTLTYDPNGNLIGDGTRTFEWDGVNRLTAINQGAQRSEFSYDGFGRRTRIIEKDNGVTTSDKRFLWVGTRMAEERDATGSTTAKRFFGQGVQDAGSSYFYMRDHLGSVRELLDAAGTVRARYDYDPYGRRTKATGDLEADLGYTSHFEHSASALKHAVFRLYDANLGRWLSRDPIGLAGGINLYAYVNDDPVNNRDALGLFNTPGHDYIVRTTFDEFLTESEIGIFQNASKFIDKNFQDPGYSYMHAMRDATRDQTACEARQLYEEFLERQLERAISLERAGYHQEALFKLGEGMHAIMDSLSPAHSDFAEWDGLDSLSDWLNLLAVHVPQELIPSPEAVDLANAALQNYYTAFMNGVKRKDFRKCVRH